MQTFGYTSEGLSRGSVRPVVRVCEGCGQAKVLGYRDCKRLCIACIHRDPEWIKIQSDSHKGKKRAAFSAETLRKMSEAHKGKKHSDETKRKMAVSQSVVFQGVSYEEWEGFVNEHLYCPLFDEACRESNRDKYNRKCFLCGKRESENITKSGKQKKLSVHHVDMDKMNGCDGHRWKLVPLCMQCHLPAHNDLVNSRIEYLLNNVWNKVI